MLKERIESLAQEVKEKNREAAEKYGRDQHYAEMIATRGKEVCVARILACRKMWMRFVVISRAILLRRRPVFRPSSRKR